MKFTQCFLPASSLWSSPFIRWQGSIAELSSNELAVLVAGAALEQRQIDVKSITALVLGQTVPQSESFYAVPLIARKLGAASVAGPLISQACATSVACIVAAAGIVAADAAQNVLVLATDRVSNGPVMVFPCASAAGGTPDVVRWVLDSFAADPCTSQSMAATAEYVAVDGGFSRTAVDEMTMLRYEQYQRALANDRQFQRRYLQPILLKGRKGVVREINADEGVHPYSLGSLAALSSGKAGGVVTFGNQTHPADGCAGAIVCSEERARAAGGALIRLVSVGFARAEPARMPKAATLAAQLALADAGLQWKDIKAVTSHNPFAVNDLWFCQQTGYDAQKMNMYGSSLIFGHPQGPTGLRSITELVHTLLEFGGGYGLFTGCAAGDVGASLVIEVSG
jgi:acetyl-CoA acetyltransferase